ncbi:MAG: ABC transporter ATP-binding protein/permease [Clostridium sp.]|jgi:ATP-binding cassette subfamily B protein|nr:ABC transporter ATP-binding protein/permease [Clostridium sp.]
MPKDKLRRRFISFQLKAVFQKFKPHALWLVLYAVISVVMSVLVILSVPIRSRFIDVVLTQGNILQAILELLLLNLFIAFLIRYGLPALLNHLAKLISHRVSLEVEHEIAQKKASICWPYYENPDVNDKIELVKDAPEQIWFYVKGIISLSSMIISTIGVFLLLIQLGVFFAALLLVLFVPIAYYSIQAGSGYYDTWERTAKLRRYCDYQRDVMMDKTYATERALFEYTPFFMKRWEADYQQTRSLSIKEELKGSKKVQLSGVIFCLYIGVMVFVIINRLSESQISAGDAVALLSIFPLLINNMIGDISNQINQLVRSKRVIGAWMDFQALEDEEGAFDLPEHGVDFSQIVFKQVSFRYSPTGNWVLKDVDMCLEKGKHYAIVGENGAGKSTLIKLILRLYRVSEGEILIDGRNINEIPRKQLLGLVSALFQDHQRYYTTVSENIALGDVNRFCDEGQSARSAEEAGLQGWIENMPGGYEAILGTMNKGGVDISGGEWQKLAIARLIMSPCPLKILDEPTAAMDPLFEYALYQDFNRIMESKTTITISHRLASCRSADYIYVLDHGSVCEEGTHEALIQEGKKYCRMYTTQKEMYA